MLDSIKQAIVDFVFNLFKGGTESFLNMITDLFQKSVDTVRMNVSETPTEFSKTLVDNLRLISDTAILPVAGLLLTYLFVYELYQMVLDKNKGNVDFDMQQFVFLIMRTAVMIQIITHSFDITLAVFDLGKWISDKVPNSALTIPKSINEKIIGSLGDGEVGAAISMWVVAGIALIIVFIMAGIIYLVAWSRIVTIMMYISVAPLAFTTFMNRDWVASIGQSYVKNLAALMLQGYFMLVCLVIYAGLLEKAGTLIADEGSGIYGLMLMIVSMAILVVSLSRTHSFGKSIMGAM